MNVLTIPIRFRPAPDDAAVIRVMTPSDFLALAVPLSPPDDAADDRLREAAMVYWEEWPFLFVDPATGQVHGHEGRHRVSAAGRSGYDWIEVILFMTPDPRDLTIADAITWTWSGSVPDTLIRESDWRERVKCLGESVSMDHGAAP